MKGQYKGWVIIALDLMIVLGIFLLYQFALKPTDTKNSSLTRQTGEITARLDLVKQGPPHTVSFKLKNNSDTDQNIPVPRGIHLMLSDGSKKYWEQQLSGTGQFRLPPNQAQSWELEVPVPKELASKPSAYLGFYINDNFQGLLQIR